MEYLTVPFKPHGRSRDGVDCWGLVCLIYAEKLGISLPLYDGVDWEDGEDVSIHLAKEAQDEWCEIPREEHREFDVIVLRIKGMPWHVGVILNSTTFIHADPVKGICIEKIDALHWKNRVLGFYRFNS